MEDLIPQLQRELRELRGQMAALHKRHVSIQDLLADRWETARFYGFGEGTSCYNNVLILGEVRVGRNTWIGPNVVLDGSGGGLVIGDNCSISAGVQVYTHNTVAWATSMGKAGYAKAPTRIGDGVFLGPNTVVALGVTIGDRAAVGAMSFVNRDIPAGAMAFGCPARVRGETRVADLPVYDYDPQRTYNSGISLRSVSGMIPTTPSA